MPIRVAEFDLGLKLDFFCNLLRIFAHSLVLMASDNLGTHFMSLATWKGEIHLSYLLPGRDAVLAAGNSIWPGRRHGGNLSVPLRIHNWSTLSVLWI
jgi:hypothetical protein